MWRNNAGNSDGIGSVNEMYCSRAEKIHAYIAYFIFYEKALFDAPFFYWKKIKKRLNTALFYGAWKNVQRKKWGGRKIFKFFPIPEKMPIIWQKSS